MERSRAVRSRRERAVHRSDRQGRGRSEQGAAGAGPPAFQHGFDSGRRRRNRACCETLQLLDSRPLDRHGAADAAASGVAVVRELEEAFSSCAPRWVLDDPRRFPRARSASGRALPMLSVFRRRTERADATACAALMHQVRRKDRLHQTVLMVQVENEIGYLGIGDRDRSARANRLFAGPYRRGCCGRCRRTGGCPSRCRCISIRRAAPGVRSSAHSPTRPSWPGITPATSRRSHAPARRRLPPAGGARRNLPHGAAAR